ncbi:nuclear transport factor 2 family protein [Bradyrhizobium sp. AC87j1]|uniref:nuclear transport factor 2 family protein n=1 Tax=Bradyrhizobium sp. AC87j1 TaxID=2055894 RepID=UPI001FE1A636|nr:nuclear transport factor 2 family protein [Bradyrhizobium sp. AC87j1]
MSMAVRAWSDCPCVRGFVSATPPQQDEITKGREMTTRTAIAELFVEEPVMYEPTDIVQGRAEISRVAANLLKQFGPTFRFIPDGVAVGHHGLAHLAWHAGPEDGPVAVTGADVAEIEGGKIARLWVLLNAQKSK